LNNSVVGNLDYVLYFAILIKDSLTHVYLASSVPAQGFGEMISATGAWLVMSAA